MRNPRFLFPVLVVLAPFNDCVAQGPSTPSPCTSSSIPASVATSDERVVRGIAPDKFRIKIEKKVSMAQGMADSGPRRILLLLDVGKPVTPDGWKMMVQVAKRLVTGGREQDRFALLTFGGPQVDLPFSDDRSLLLNWLEGMEQNRPRPALDGGHIYDGIFQAAMRFGPGVYGDSIFVLAGGADTSSRTSAGAVLTALQKGPIRLFGFTMSRNDLSDAGAAVRVEQLETSPEVRALSHVAIESGGQLMAENTRPFNRPFAATDSRIEKVFQVSWRLYGQIAETYRFDLGPATTAKPETWEVSLPKEIEDKVPGIQVRTPRKILRCTGNSPT